MAPSAAYAGGGMSLIEFNLDGSIGCGIRIVDVLNGNIEGLAGRDDIVVFNPDRGSIRLKIEVSSSSTLRSPHKLSCVESFLATKAS